ncbi:MAG: hypothetical protein ABH841_01830 [Candidatus Nealsonbacteria bacterium]
MPEKNYIPEKIVLSPEVEALREKIGKVSEGQFQEKAPEEKEKIIKDEIKSYLHELQGVPAATAPLATRDEADEIKKFPANQQVGALVALAFEKSLGEAIRVARRLDNPAILDEFHDILIDRYYQALIQGKKFKA